MNTIDFRFSSPISSSRLHDDVTSSHSLPIHTSSQRLHKDERDLDADEESWFNDDTDENKISTGNHGSLFNGGSDDEDSQPEITESTNPSAISTMEPIRAHHSAFDNDDDELPLASSDSTLKTIDTTDSFVIDSMC